MLTLKQIEEIIKLNRDTKSIKYVDENKNPIEPTEKSIVEDIEYTEYFNGGPFGGYSEHNYIITIKNEDSLENQSFIKYLLNKFDSKFTIASKILLLIFSCSLFIPVPTVTTTHSDVKIKILTLYLSLVTIYGIALVLFLAGTYLDFISDKPSENNKFKLLLASVTIAPIISCVTYLTFNIVTPLQLVSTIPTIVLFVMYMLELDWVSHLNFDFTKIKKIFFKK